MSSGDPTAAPELGGKASVATAGSAVSALWFDGRRAAAQPVQLHIAGRRLLAVAAPSGRTAPQTSALTVLDLPLDGLQWPERQRHGQAQILLPEGGMLVPAEGADWSGWLQANGVAESAVVRWQQSWSLSLSALALMVLLVVAGWLWGVPWAARMLTPWVPPAVVVGASDAALAALDRSATGPSASSAADRQRIAALWTQAQQRWPVAQATPTELVFRQGHRLGPNALALPDGRIVLTDELLALLADRDDVLLGVLGHESAHVRERHGLRLVTQAALVGAFGTLLIGDFSSVLAAAPGALAAQAYSRDMEREADAAAVDLLRANGLAPAVMVVLFERLAQARSENTGHWASALASHPGDAERIAFFRNAGQR